MEKPKTEQSAWTPEFTEKLINDLKDLAKEWMNYKQSEAETKIKHLQAESEAEDKYIQATAKHNRNTLYALIGFLGAVIAFMSILTYLGRVSGDALLFLVGTVTGYIIILIQRLIFVFTPEATQEEESKD